MLICIDYDKTYTEDPQLWESFMTAARGRGHEFVCATMRHESEPITMNCPVIYTSRAAKLPFLKNLGIKPGVFIDDNPAWLYQDSF